MRLARIAAIALLITSSVFAIACGSSSTSNPTATPTLSPTATPISTQLVTVTYSSTIASQIETNYPKSRYVYLIMSMEIWNQGYEHVNMSRNDFYTVVNNVKYYTAPLTLSSDLFWEFPSSMSISDGVQDTFKAAFEVPIGTTTFSMQYGGYGTYNIQWVQQ